MRNSLTLIKMMINIQTKQMIDLRRKTDQLDEDVSLKPTRYEVHPIDKISLDKNDKAE